MKRVFLLFIFILTVHFNSAQVIYYFDTFNGGSTGDGYAPDYFGSGSETLNINIAPGSTIRSAYLLASRLGPAADVIVTLGGTPVTFNMANEVTGGYASLYGTPSGVHVADVSAIINPAINNYVITVPPQSSTVDRYQGFYLYVAYENPALQSVTTSIVLNDMDVSTTNYNYNITFPTAIDISGDVGVAGFNGYLCGIGDGQNVFFNGNPLGEVYGPDLGDGDCGGPIGSYFYQNQTLTGLNGDNPDITTTAHDLLFNAVTMIPVSTTNVTIDFNHSSGGSDNHVYAMFFNWGSSCIPPVFNIGPDISICNGTDTTLSAPSGYTYLWSTGATTQNIQASTSGTYWVQITDSSGCSGVDSVLLTVNPLPVINLGTDFSLCVGDDRTLNAGAGFSSYLWSDGSITQTIIVNQIGTYSVNITDANGCINSDIVNVVSINPLPTPNLGNDQTICSGNPVTLSLTQTYSTYNWSTGATTSTITVGAAGQYIVEVTDVNGCENTDTISVIVSSTPTFSLGNDMAICVGDTFTLAPDVNFVGASYLWSDSSTLSNLITAQDGVYSLTITTGDNCSYTDYIILVDDCEYPIYIPNAFTPNNDEVNPIFYAYSLYIVEFSMEIFNRWGESIFISNDISKGWNGKYKNTDCQQGVYSYKVHYKLTNGEENILYGQVNLLR